MWNLRTLIWATWSHLSCVELHIFHSRRFRVVNGFFVAIRRRVLFHTLLLSLFPRIQGLSVFNWKFDDRTSIFCENFWVVVLKKSFQICSIIFVLMIYSSSFLPNFNLSKSLIIIFWRRNIFHLLWIEREWLQWNFHSKLLPYTTWPITNPWCFQ